MGWISLNKLEFFAYHGYYEAERVEGNTFIINLSVKTDFKQAALSDDLPGTVDYEQLYAIVKQEMGISRKLLETLVWQIAQRILAEIKNVNTVKIELFKLSPPIEGKCESSSVKIKLKK
jgi:dihydroneopterin aldolase